MWRRGSRNTRTSVYSLEELIRRAGECGVLSELWPLLRDLMQLENKIQKPRKRTFTLSTIWLFDWENLCKLQQQQQHFVFDNEPIKYPHNSRTAALLRLACSSAPDQNLVKFNIHYGASVNVVSSNKHILVSLAHSGGLQALQAALRTSEPIDFTAEHTIQHKNFGVESVEKTNVLHGLFVIKDEAVAAAVLDMVVERLQTHPEDRYDFSSVSAPLTRLADVIVSGRRLAVFCWSRVKDFPYYADTIRRIPIQVLSWKDMELLGDEIEHFEKQNRRYFEYFLRFDDYYFWNEEVDLKADS